MTIKHVVLAISLIAALTNNYATAMEKKSSSNPTMYRYTPRRPSYQIDRGRLSYPVSTISPYKEDPNLYENIFKSVLQYRLAYFKCEGKSESSIQNYEQSLLRSMQAQKTKIIENKIRETYYPKIKTIEWQN